MNYWAWGGKYIGHRSGDCLYSSHGEPLGRFSGNEIYDFDGKYIGEIKNENRLIVDTSKRSKRASVSSKPCNSIGSSYADYVGSLMYAGYDDFEVKS